MDWINQLSCNGDLSMDALHLIWVSFSLQTKKYQLCSTRLGPSAQLGLQALAWFDCRYGEVTVYVVIRRLIHSFQLAVLGISIPSFVFAALLQYSIGLKLGWLPLLAGGFAATATNDCLGNESLGNLSRFIRTEMVDVLARL